MRDILRELSEWRRRGEGVALATVVDARGSVPRSPGARLAVSRSGAMIGSISAGCVESDVCARAVEVLDGSAPVLARYQVTDSPETEVGLACGGSIDVLIERFEEDAAWKLVCGSAAGERPVALVVVLSPAEAFAARVAVTSDEVVVEPAGALPISLRDRIVADARARLVGDAPAQVVEYECKGRRFSVLIDPIRPRWRLVVLGATDTATVLARLAKILGYHVTIVDARSAYLKTERFPDADLLHLADVGRPFQGLNLGDTTYVVTLTHEPRFDIPALAAALRAVVAYVGALGSRKTHAKRLELLRAEGLSEEALARIHGPVGLDIGGRASEEIALSIVAEMQAVRYGRRPLRREQAPPTSETSGAGEQESGLRIVGTERG